MKFKLELQHHKVKLYKSEDIKKSSPDSSTSSPMNDFYQIFLGGEENESKKIALSSIVNSNKPPSAHDEPISFIEPEKIQLTPLAHKSYELSICCILFPILNYTKHHHPQQFVNVMNNTQLVYFSETKGDEIILLFNELCMNGMEWLHHSFPVNFDTFKQTYINSLKTNQNLFQEIESRQHVINSHPYYNAASFQNERYLENWKKWENDNIKALKGLLDLTNEPLRDLVIKVMEGKNFPETGKGGKPLEVYIKIHFAGIDKRTRQISNTTNPIWTEEFTFHKQGASKEKKFSEIVITICDAKKKKPKIGELVIPTEELEKHVTPMADRWFDVDITWKEKLKEHKLISSKKQLHTIKSKISLSIWYLARNIHSPIHSQSSSASALTAATSAVTNTGNQKPGGGSGGWIYYHETFTELQCRLLNLDNKGEEFLNKNISSLSKNILKEYEFRFGIHPFYSELSLLKMLVANIVPRKDYLVLVLDVLQSCRNEKVNAQFITIRENEDYNQLLDSIRKKIILWLANYDVMWRKSELGGLRVCLDILRSFLDSVEVLDICRDALNEKVYHAYRRTKASCEGIVSNDYAVIELLSSVAEIVLMNLTNDLTYEPHFPEECDFLNTIGKLWYKLLSADVCNSLTPDIEVCVEIFNLYFKLTILHDRLKDWGVKADFLDLKDVFGGYIPAYFQEAKKRMIKWSKDAIAQDKWHPLLPDSTAPVLHSSCVVDIFSSLEQAFNFFKRTNIDLENNVFGYAEIVCEIISFLTRTIKITCLEDIAKIHNNSPTNAVIGTSSSSGNSAFDLLDETVVVEYLKVIKNKLLEDISKGTGHNIMGARDSARVLTTITIELCVRLNNLRTISEHFDTFQVEFMDLVSNDLSDSMKAMIRGSMKAVETDFNQLVDVATSKMNNAILISLKKVLEIEVGSSFNEVEFRQSINSQEYLETRCEYLLSYLIVELDMLSDFLYAPVFAHLIFRVWVMILEDLDKLIFPTNLQLGVKSRHYIAMLVDKLLPTVLVPFFEAGGHGVPLGKLNESIGGIREALSLFEKPTSYLIEHFEKLENSTQPQTRDASSGRLTTRGPSAYVEFYHILAVLSTRSSEKEATKFVKEKESKMEDRVLIKRFNLPSSDSVLGKFKCVNSNMLAGVIHVTTTHICFESILFRSSSAVTPILSIVSLLRVEADKGLDICLQDLQVIHYARISHLEQLYTLLVQQSQNIGGHLEYYSRLELSPELRSLLSLPLDEQLLQVYACSQRGKLIGPKSGELLITTSFICFKSVTSGMFKSKPITIPISTIATVTKLGTHDLEIRSDAFKYTFSGFSDRDSVCNNLATIGIHVLEEKDRPKSGLNEAKKSPLLKKLNPL